MIGPDDLLLVCRRGNWVDGGGGWGNSETKCLGERSPPTEPWLAGLNLEEVDPFDSLGIGPLCSVRVATSPPE